MTAEPLAREVERDDASAVDWHGRQFQRGERSRGRVAYKTVILLSARKNTNRFMRGWVTAVVQAAIRADYGACARREARWRCA